MTPATYMQPKIKEGQLIDSNDLKSWHYFPAQSLQPLPLRERATPDLTGAQSGEGWVCAIHPRFC
jgi:hypothetical protein